MRDSITLGRIAGVRFGINWSWLVVFALIVWTWATGIFPETNPGLSEGTYVAMAVIGAVLFFGSLLAHELGHALQARREGMEIEGITLWLFGGVAKFKGMFPSAGAEFRIAIAGPVVSLAAGLFMLIFQGAFSGAWLAFLGWFLLQAAGAEARYLAARQALGGLRVRDLMVTDPVTVPPDITLGRFMDDVVWQRRHTTYPVVEDGRALGLLPFRCVAEVPRGEWDERLVRD